MPPEVGNMPVAMEPLSRRVYVGLGQYGALVADEIRLQLQREPSGLNQRTVVLDFQAGRPPLGPSDGLSAAPCASNSWRRASLARCSSESTKP